MRIIRLPKSVRGPNGRRVTVFRLTKRDIKHWLKHVCPLAPEETPFEEWLAQKGK